jgi:hypothetical protein
MLTASLANAVYATCEFVVAHSGQIFAPAMVPRRGLKTSFLLKPMRDRESGLRLLDEIVRLGTHHTKAANRPK